MVRLKSIELVSVYLKRVVIFLIIIACNIILSTSISSAGQIDKGTWSLGGSSNVNYIMTGPEDGNVDAVKSFNVAITGGYFVANNFEIELGFDFTLQETESYTSHSYSFIPMINYHFPITDNTNFYSGVGFSLGRSEYDYYGYYDPSGYYDRYAYQSDTESFGYGIKLGFEFFISRNAAITLAASYWKFESSYEGSFNSKMNRLAIPQIGIKLYF